MAHTEFLYNITALMRHHVRIISSDGLLRYVGSNNVAVLVLHATGSSREIVIDCKGSREPQMVPG